MAARAASVFHAAHDQAADHQCLRSSARQPRRRRGTRLSWRLRKAPRRATRASASGQQPSQSNQRPAAAPFPVTVKHPAAYKPPPPTFRFSRFSRKGPVASPLSRFALSSLRFLTEIPDAFPSKIRGLPSVQASRLVRARQNLNASTSCPFLSVQPAAAQSSSDTRRDMTKTSKQNDPPKRPPLAPGFRIERASSAYGAESEALLACSCRPLVISARHSQSCAVPRGLDRRAGVTNVVIISLQDRR